MKNRTIITWVTFLLTFVATRVATAQTWDGNNTKIGQQQPGGFDYNWAKYAAGAFGDRTVRFDYSGARPILHAPAVGVHPRIYFNPEEIPAIADRLNNTNNGREVAKKMRAFNILLHKGKAGFNTHADYNTTPAGMVYIDNAGYYDLSAGYQKLVRGDTTNYTHYLTASANRWTSALCMEAFACLLNKGQPTDTEIGISYEQRATDLAQAMTTIATTAVARGQLNPAKGAGGVGSAVGVGLAIAYDLNYWALTTDQRNRVRKAIAACVPNKPINFADEHEPYATTGNWAALDSFEPITNFAIEGETGYQPTLTHAWMRVLYNFVTYGWNQNGGPWEGLGKNYLMVGQQLAFAKRGFSLLGHPHLKAYGSNYLPAHIQPFGFAFMSEDTWGGFGPDPTVGKYRFNVIDAVGLKYAYPNDPAIDFVWRNYTHNTIAGNEVLDYAKNIGPGSFTYFDVMTILGAYVEDSTPGDWTAQNKVALKNKLDFFEDTRGQAILRSDFTPNALLANFYVRQNFGGHTYADRNDVAVSALGRIWFTKRYGGRGLEETDAQSCLLVDGKGMSVHGGVCKVPAKMERWNATTQLSQATGDATHAYSWEYNGDPLPATVDTKLLGQNGWVKETKTLNDFRAYPVQEAYFNIPFYDFAYWGNGPKGTLERVVKRPFNPMEKVFRTVAMAKGKHPFLLIMDDIKKDANTHKYEWVAQLPEDIELDKVVPSTNTNEQCFDVLLKEKNEGKKLLVRVLNQSDYVKGTAPAVKVEQHAYVGSDGKNYSVYRLAITSTAVSPDFKILVFPFSGQEALPVTTWSSNKTTLRVDFNDEHTTLSLINNTTGSTSVQLIKTTATAIGAAAPWSFTLAPNPARTAATLDLPAVPGAGTAVLTLLDGLGRAVRTETVTVPAAGLRHELRLAGLAPGLYLLRATAGATAATRRLVVE